MARRAETRPQRLDRLGLGQLEEVLANAALGPDAALTRDSNAPTSRRIDRLATAPGCGLIPLTSDD